jgi:hypothetical protein
VRYARKIFTAMKRLHFVIIAMTSLLMTGLSGTTQANPAGTSSNDLKGDSIELRQLIIKLLKWHESDLHGVDFPLVSDKTSDSIYTGINWAAHKQRVKQLENTGFFTKEFLSTYQKIAEHLDKELKHNKEKYRIGDLPPYDHANEWCDCQDYPTNVWKRLRIKSIKINGESATFKWTWASDFSYSVRAQKVGGNWQIAQLEKFDIRNFIW